MDYSEFQEKMKKEVAKNLGNDYEVIVKKMEKNNGTASIGLSISKLESKISPVIYLENFYLRHLKGEEFFDLTEDILKIYESTDSRRKIFEGIDMEYETCKSRIVYRLISSDKNKKILNDIPYIPFLDLAIVFSVIYENDDNVLESIRIDNAIMKRWGVTTNDLYEKAKLNTPKIFPQKIENLDELIFDSVDDSKKDVAKSVLKSISPFIILTNNKGVQGASVLLYENVLNQVAEMLKSDLYILPSSIHEVLVLPFSETYDRDKLAEMVSEVNESKVAEEDVLSDCVYVYRFAEKRIDI